MALNSIEFLIFLPVAALVYYIVPKKIRPAWLLIVSICFYLFSGPKHIVWLAVGIMSSYSVGLLLEKGKSKGVLAVGIIINAGMLCFFKFYGKIYPLGISFFTFQVIGYMIDVYRGKMHAEKNLLYYALFVSFFPHISSGPIARAEQLLPQLREPKDFDFEGVRSGILMMLWGFFLKLVMANRIALYVDAVYANYEYYRGWYTIVAILLYSIQIYCDFYGYTMIAAGTAKTLGISLLDNFRAPYLCSSVVDFWRNWHISLTSWFRDYLYIPLGGSRKGTLRKYLNKMTVFLVSGLWHGTSFGFLIWGGLNGAYQVVEEIAAPVLKRIPVFVRGIFSYILISIAWVFFRANGARDAIAILINGLKADNFSAIASGEIFNLGVNIPNSFVLGVSLLILLGSDILLKKNICVHDMIGKVCVPVRVLLIAFSVLLIMLFGLYGPAFNAADFIYYQF